MKRNGNKTAARPPLATDRLAPPSHDAVEWECSGPKDLGAAGPVVIRVQTWFEARQQAAALLGVSPDKVHAVPRRKQ